MLSIVGLAAGYGNGRVLRGVDLELRSGSILALLGRNGMGKTTLMRSIMGLLPVAAGRILFRDRDIVGLRPDQISNLGIAYVPQGRGVFAEFSVSENLRLGVLGKDGVSDEIPATVYREFPLIAARCDQRAGTLSGGEQQQLAIARALIGRPRLLLLDEPTEGIQPSVVEQIGASLARIARDEGLTVLLVEQNVEMALETAEDCAFMENGHIVARYTAAQVRRDAALVHRHLAL